MSARAAELEAAGVAFVEATVVRCAAPTSARPGDRAIVLGDGTIEGFVGGSCADATVRLQALRALETGEPVLLRILPGEEDGPERRGGRGRRRQPVPERRRARAVPRAAPAAAARRGRRRVAGRARARRSCAAPLGLPRRGSGAVAEPGDFAAVVASLGHGDEDARAARRSRRAASTSGSSPRACAARRCSTRCAPTACRRRRSRACARPRAWTSARARTRRSRSRSSPSSSRRGARRRCRRRARSAPREAVDPVCGMTVVVGPDTPTAGERAFCCEGCRERLARTCRP